MRLSPLLLASSALLLAACSSAPAKQTGLSTSSSSAAASMATAETATVTTTWKQDAADKRPLLTLAEAERVRAGLLAKQSSAQGGAYPDIGDEMEAALGLHKQAHPTTTVTVSDPLHGLTSMALPYDPAWISDHYALPPYYTYGSDFSFGPLIYDWHGTALYRTMGISFQPARTFDAALAEAEQDSLRIQDKAPVTLTVNGVKAVQYVVEQSDSAPITLLEIPGKKANYVLDCWSDGYGYDAEPKADCAALLQVAQSMKFE